MNSNATSPVGTPNALRMNIAERRELIAALCQLDATTNNIAARKQVRFALPEGYSIAAIVQQPGGAPQQTVLVVRDISNGGISFLHHHYLSTGTRLHLVLVGADRQPLIRVEASVVRCAHARGMAHDVGAKFDQPIDIASMLGVQDPSQAARQSPAPDPTGPTLHGVASELHAGLLVKLVACGDQERIRAAIEAAIAVIEMRVAA